MDPIFHLIQQEEERQKNCINLIASENFTPEEVLRATGSVLTNKYAEGYPGRRYYKGCVYVDEIETIACDRLKTLFGAAYANVQPHSGASANLAVYYALLEPGNKIMGMSLSAGGHLTHGASVTISGKWFTPIPYQVHPETYLLDYEEIRQIALRERPHILVAGASAYPRVIDFQKFREIADEVGCYLLADVAHYAGLIAAGQYPNPVPYADVVTSTTHKTLRGPRGGIILSGRADLAKKLDQAVMPGTQGGPLMHVIAAKGVAFGLAAQPEFKAYIQRVIQNAQHFAACLQEHGFRILTGGTDSHLILMDIRNICENGAVAASLLEEIGIISNFNGIPFDTASPLRPSGLRFGTPAMTTRGFVEKHFTQLADIIQRALRKTTPVDVLREEVGALCHNL